MAQTVANDMVKDKEKALKAAQNAKSKGGATIAEKIASEQERKANIQNAEQELAIWQAIASVPEARQQAIAKAQAQAEAERIKAEEAEVEGRTKINLLDPRTMPEEEKKRRVDMLRNANTIDVIMGTITSTPELSARKAAEKWWDDNVSEPALYDTEVGEVEINRNSIESSLAHRYGQKKLDAITSLIDGFENAVYLGTMPDSRERGVVDHYFAYPIMYNRELNYVFCRAMQDANKNRLYVHEVFIADKIKMGDTLQTAASKPHGGISLYRDILANVLEASTEMNASNSKDTTSSQNNNEIEDKNVQPTIGEQVQASEAEVKQAQAQYEEYAELMKKELEQKEAKYAEMDSTIEAADDISNTEEDDDVLYRSDDATKNRIEALFNQAISGEFKGKPISIGTLTDEGKAYLEQISGISFRERVDFVLNPSDLVHIYKDHFGNNEKDKGQNIPLDIEDIRSLADVITMPDKVVFFKEGEGSNRNMFYFFKEAENGTYNLMEIYSDRKGNLTAKTFYKTRKDASQRVMDIEKSLLPTSETYFGAILSDAKIPQMFETPSVEDNYSREGEGAVSDEDVTMASDPVSKAIREPRYGRGKKMREYAERQRRHMERKAREIAERLNLDNVEIVTDASTLLVERSF